jgi:hypothetical protein
MERPTGETRAAAGGEDDDGRSSALLPSDWQDDAGTLGR